MLQKKSILYRLFALSVILCCVTCVSSDSAASKSRPNFDVSEYTQFAPAKYKGEEVGDVYSKIQHFIHPKTGKKIVMFGMIHIADSYFYKRIQKELDAVDLVLTEGVNLKQNDPLLIMQLNYIMGLMNRLSLLLNLSSQHMLKPGEHWQNADLNGEDMGKGELISDQYAMSSNICLVSPIIESLLFTLNLTKVTTGLLGKEYEDMLNLSLRKVLLLNFFKNKLDSPGSPGSEKKIVINKRNNHLISELDKALLLDNVNTVAIPWGAEHCTGVEDMILERGFVKGELNWIKAISPITTSETSFSNFNKFPFISLLSYQNEGDLFHLSALFSFTEFTKKENNWMLAVGYDLLAKIHKSGFSFLNIFLQDGWINGAYYKNNFKFSLCDKLLFINKGSKNVEFGLQPLFHNYSTPISNKFTMLGVELESGKDNMNLALNFDKSWPLYYANNSGESVQILWPLLDIKLYPDHSFKEVSSIWGLLHESYSNKTKDLLYINFLKGLLLEYKATKDFEYLKIFSLLFSRLKEDDVLSYDILWPLISTTNSPTLTEYSIFPLYSYIKKPEEVEHSLTFLYSYFENKNEKESYEDFSLLLGLLCTNSYTNRVITDDKSATPKKGKEEREILIKTTLASGLLYYHSYIKNSKKIKDQKYVLLGLLGIETLNNEKSFNVLGFPVWSWSTTKLDK